MNIAQIKKVIKANATRILSFITPEDGIYFVTYLPKSSMDSYTAFNKIRLALKKAGGKVSKIIEHEVNAGTEYRGYMVFTIDDNFDVYCCFDCCNSITELMTIEIRQTYSADDVLDMI